MSGSGNDFVFFDTADGVPENAREPEVIAKLCARGTGIGADGIVIMDRADPSHVSIDYYNSDGSVGELCGNATLCTVRLQEMLGGSTNDELSIKTEAGEVRARTVDGLPEIDLAPVTKVASAWSSIPLEPPESRLGHAIVGVPHAVFEVPDVDKINVKNRGSRVRHDPSFRKGANVNFVAPWREDTWAIRTYERGVEGETLACGTGAVAAAILLVAWGHAKSPVTLLTRSGRELVVTVRQSQGAWLPSLRGPAELVFTGELPQP
jgi:diaminopimelate epimerase